MTTRPRLYYMNSRVLNGFYQSDLFVVAETKDGALEAAGRVYDAWLADYIAEMGYHPLLSGAFPDEDDYQSRADEKRTALLEEARGCLLPIEGVGMIRHAS